MSDVDFERSECDGAFVIEGTNPNTYFMKNVKFRNLDIRGTFSLRDVKFDLLPDFVQAHFKEPPDLDLVELPVTRGRFSWWFGGVVCKSVAWGSKRFLAVIRRKRKQQKTRAPELTARWRALKRMAIQTGHHYYTALFAAEETRARRPIDWKQRKSAWLIGWIYQGLSNFGLSIWRPLAWWAASLFLFAVFYDDRSSLKPLSEPPNSGICRLFDGTGWIGEKFGAALTYSLEKALVVGGLAKVEGLDGLGTCLFGDPIPLAVIFAGILQTAFSGLLILLFVLAIRNHMRAR